MKRCFWLFLLCISLAFCMSINPKPCVALDAPVITYPTNTINAFPMDDTICTVTFTTVAEATAYACAIYDITDGIEVLIKTVAAYEGFYTLRPYYVDENRSYKLVIIAHNRNVSPVVSAYSNPVYINIGVREYNSEIIGHTIPSVMEAGNTYNTTVTFKNTGSKTWTKVNQDELRISGENNILGMNNFIELNDGENVLPGNTHTFHINITPSASGEYYFRIEMRHGDKYFGDDEKIEITSNPSNKLLYDAKVISSEIPNDMKAGREYSASITVQNTGQIEWSGNDIFALCPISNENNHPSAKKKWISNEIVASGATKTFIIPLKCNIAGIYSFNWQMCRNTTPFGEELMHAVLVSEIKPTAIDIDVDACRLVYEEDPPLQLIATILPDDTTNKLIEWDSTDKSVAIVSDTGLVTPVGVGGTTIFAHAMGEPSLYDICRIDVVAQKAVTGISLSESKIVTTATAIPFQIFATIFPSDATNKRVTWTSTNPAIATVSSTGMIDPIKNGRTIIIATATENSSISSSCEVIVGSEDNQYPYVVQTRPASNASNVAITSRNITIEFNESVFEGVNFNSIQVISKTYNNAVVPISKGTSGKYLSITRDGDWTKDNIYQVTIPAGAVKDTADNNLAADYVFSFSTGSELIIGTLGIPTITTPADQARIPLGVSSGFQVQWNTVTGAERYAVGIKEVGASYYEKTYDNITSLRQEISCVGASLIAGHDYIIEVFAHKGSQMTKTTREITMVTAEPTIITPRQSNIDINNIDISWEPLFAGNDFQEVSYKVSFFDITANQAVSGYNSKTVTNTSLTLPAAIAIENHRYRVTVTGVNNNVEGESATREFTVIKSGDTTKPSVVSTTPANGATVSVALGTVSVKYNEAILAGNNLNSITISPGMSSASLTNRVTGDQLEIKVGLTASPALFEAGKIYTVNIPAGAVKDSAGNLCNPYTFSFTINASGDGSSPYVVSTTPNNGQQNVNPEQDIRITFNETIVKQIDRPVQITTDAYGPATDKTDQILDTTGKTLTISRNDGAQWTTDVIYYLTILADNITDASGNNLAADYVFSFSTGEGGASSIASPTATPAAGAVVYGTTVSLNTPTAGAAIYYTLDGTEPTTSSTRYTNPIPITAAVTIKAIAVASGMTNSAVMSASYTISLQNVSILLDGQNIAFAHVPYIKNQILMVPIREMYEHLGLDVVYWDSITKTVHAENDHCSLAFQIGNSVAVVNGATVFLDTMPEIKGNVFFVPIRFSCEAVGYGINWNNETKTASITTTPASTNKIYRTDIYPGDMIQYDDEFMVVSRIVGNPDQVIFSIPQLGINEQMEKLYGSLWRLEGLTTDIGGEHAYAIEAYKNSALTATKSGSITIKARPIINSVEVTPSSGKVGDMFTIWADVDNADTVIIEIPGLLEGYMRKSDTNGKWYLKKMIQDAGGHEEVPFIIDAGRESKTFSLDFRVDE